MMNLKNRNRSGMILLTVLMVILILSIFVAAIITQELNKSSGIQAQIDEIVAKELAIGAFWKAHADRNAGNLNPTVAPPETLGTVGTSGLATKTYTPALDNSGIPDTTGKPYLATVSY